jgi:isopentenyl phosphate kinase
LNPVVLKLGGSVITAKEKPMTPNLKAIRRLAGEIEKAGVKPLLIVHGGGGFGHWWASKYRINEGYSDPSQIMGFSKTHQAMVALSRLVVDALARHNVPAVAVQPSSCILTKSGRIHVMEERPLRRLLEVGFVPVLYGDAVLDTKLGFTILSGDQLAAELALRIGAKLVVFGVDVDGLYTADPKSDPAARLLGMVGREQLEAMVSSIGGSRTPDVTGGMKGKIREVLPLVRRGVKVHIVNACAPENVYKALTGREVRGTILGDELE